jgi:hypothetical protein
MLKEIVKKCMESAMEEMFPEVPFRAESEIRMAWGEPSDEIPFS